MNNFNKTLTDILKKDLRFLDQDGDLLKSEVIDKAWKVDKPLIEPKGSHLKETDKWKEDFLKQIKEKHKDKVIKFSESRKYKITGVPFYNNENENEFKEALHSTLI